MGLEGQGVSCMHCLGGWTPFSQPLCQLFGAKKYTGQQAMYAMFLLA